MFRRFIILAAMVLASPAVAQTVTLTSPDTRNPSGQPKTVTDVFVRNPDGTIATIGGASGGGGTTGFPADVQGSGTLAAATVGSAYTVPVTAGQNVVTFYLTGVAASGATVVAEGTNDGVNWNALYSARSPTGLLDSAFTADGGLSINTAGRRGVRIRVSVAGTGTITVASTLSVSVREVRLDAALPPGANTIGSLLNIAGTISLPTGAATAANQTTQIAAEQTTQANLTNGTQISRITGRASSALPATTADGVQVPPWLGSYGQAIPGSFGVAMGDGTFNAGVVGLTISAAGNTAAPGVFSFYVDPASGNSIYPRGNASGAYVQQILSALAATGVAPTAATAVSSGVVLKNTAGNLFSVNVVTGATNGYVMLLDATAIPADGAVAPKKCYTIGANTALDTNYRSAPVYFTTGIVVVFSTTGCFNKTASATAFISGDVK